jgi:hypothetical protein
LVSLCSFSPEQNTTHRFVLERVMGIEPTFLAWEATFLPLEDTRDRVDFRGLPTVVANDSS